MRMIACMIVVLCVMVCVGCATNPNPYDDGVISGAKAVVWLQSKGLTTTNITWKQVLDVGRQLEGANVKEWEALEAEGK